MSVPPRGSNAPSGSGVVLVGSKLPHGLHIDLPGFPRATLAGNAFPQDQGPRRDLPGGFAITPLPRDLMEAWFVAYATYPPVKQGLVFMAASHDHAEGHAQEHAELRTGFERLDPDNLGIGLERFDPQKADT